MKFIGGTVAFFLLVLLVSCKKHEISYPYKNLEYSYYDTIRNKRFAVSNKKVQWYIDSMRIAAHDTAFVDLYVDKYYAARKPYLWIDTKGTDNRIDSLNVRLKTVISDGINLSTVFYPYIKDALERLRNFDFDDSHDINLCLAKIEYFSTKALARYASGMRFGFVNPYKLYNRLDLVNDDDSLCTDYRTLYDAQTETPGKKYMEEVINSIVSGEFIKVIDKAACRNEKYLILRSEYSKAGIGINKKRMLAANMERYRWRRSETKTEKYVWINLPEFVLRATDEESGEELEMKICEGSVKHKTPQLTSNIERLELNPVWTVPQSIISKEIAPKHAEDEGYFERNKMMIIEKASGEEVDVSTVSAEMLKSGKYKVVQSKGEGNALGRMIFRFKNNFSIFLHDTPNRDAFNRPFRAVSHGCIRLEKPFELAVFLLDDKAPLVIDKMRIALDMPPETEEGMKPAEKENHPVMGVKSFKPAIPLYITYLTAYPDKNGNIVYTQDPYGYDDKIMSLLHNY